MSKARKLAQESRIMCDLEDMAKTSWRIGDWAGVLTAVTGFIHVLRRPL